jgi:hypothetical protein
LRERGSVAKHGADCNGDLFAMDTPSQPIVIVDVRVPFARLVLFLVKLALAAIPAAIILAVVSFLLSFLFAALFGWQMDFMMRRGTV